MDTRIRKRRSAVRRHDGQRRLRPRLPKNGYYFIAHEIPPAAGERGYDAFRFHHFD